ncbi:hypothetical protein [Calothrix parietina]|uniref:hypothetical protein n=1 Tax=Calothrix parietina TaxID=32054 RepID=UPI0030DBC6B3
MRYQEHRSITKIHQQLCSQGVCIGEHSVTHLLNRYDQLLAAWLNDQSRLKLKKHVRGICQIEHSVIDSDEPFTQIVHGYCLAVRGSLTNDGRPPLDSSGLKLLECLSLIEVKWLKKGLAQSKGDNSRFFPDTNSCT